MPIPYAAIAVTNWFIERNRTHNGNLTPLKVQKLLYFSQAIHLADHKTPLFNEEILIWSYGPVIVEIYNLLKHYREEEINTLIKQTTAENNKSETITPTIDNDDKQTIDFLNNIWTVYAPIKPWTLANMSFTLGPSKEVLASLGDDDNKNQIIPKEMLGRIFTKYLLDYRTRQAESSYGSEEKNELSLSTASTSLIPTPDQFSEIPPRPYGRTTGH
ncbi:MAG: DUF4065 domain-containing protein [Deltaproteobacteria bacterium]|jgi:uncharacterized phage-associated protein|nr:DUF4065 domain-containing protein [Deltaproteobacteria bacterium]